MNSKLALHPRRLIAHKALPLLLIIALINCTSSRNIEQTARLGAIAGCVFDLQGSPEAGIQDANVLLKGTQMGAAAGKDGKFIITDVPPGRYDITAGAFAYHRLTILNVLVAPDSVTILHLGLRWIAIPEEPFPLQWDELPHKKMRPLKQFLQSGQIFDIECELN